MDAFLFDLDGLLVDSEPLHFEAFKIESTRRGFKVPWDFTTYCQKAHSQSMGLKKAFLELFPEAEALWPEMGEAIKLEFAALILSRPFQLMEGVLEFLNLLNDNHKKMAVVTNSSAAMVLAILAQQPLLKLIPLWITREDYVQAKPAPDGYLKALELLSVSADRACGFEDSPRGVKALKAAGVRAYHIHPSTLHETLYYPSFTQLMHSQDWVIGELLKV